MGLNPDYIGRSYPAESSYSVGREKIREFATALGALDPCFFEDEAAHAAGYPAVIAPPTFAITYSMRLADLAIADPGLGLDYSRVVHGDQRFVYHRPIHAGDELSGVLVIEDIRKVGPVEQLKTRADIVDADGAPVCSAFTTLVVRPEGS